MMIFSLFFALLSPAAGKISAKSKWMILNDSQHRISSDFRVPNGLHKRVSFWFDVYSQYDSEQHIFHHTEYPWLIYSVVDTSKIPHNPKNRWSKHHNGERLVRAERRRLVKIFRSLSKKTKYVRLSSEEQRIFNLLREVPGKRQLVFKRAAVKLRSQLGQKDYIVRGIENSQKYMPYLEEIFRQRGVPLEITRLPLVESSFNEAAVSKVGASGIWQLMPEIGKKFLYVTADYDERNSPIKAADAAARLLQQNQQILKTWPLAITAYNHGPGGLRQAQKKLKTNDISVIVADYSTDSFGFASSNFYCSFLAALYVEKYKSEIFGPLPAKKHLELRTVEMPQAVYVRDVAAAVGLGFKDLRSYNLDIKHTAFIKNRKLPKGYRVFVPAEHSAQLTRYLQTLN